MYNAAGCQGYDVIESVEGSGDSNKTVTVTFAEPYADWVALFTPIFPKHAFEAAGNGDPVAGFNTGFKIENLPSGDAITDYVVSGAQFIVTDYQPGVSMTLERNPDYWGENTAKVDTLLVRWITEGTQQAAGVAERRGRRRSSRRPSSTWSSRCGPIPTATTFIGFGTFWEHLDPNQDNVAPGRAPRCGQAVGPGDGPQRDRRAAAGPVRPVGRGAQQPAVLPGRSTATSTTPVTTPSRTSRRAKAALEGAGYVAGADGVYEHPERGRLSMRITWRDPNERRQSTAQLIQAQLAEAGIEIVFAPQPDFEFLDAGNFDLALFGWTGGSVLSSHDSDLPEHGRPELQQEQQPRGRRAVRPGQRRARPGHPGRSHQPDRRAAVAGPAQHPAVPGAGAAGERPRGRERHLQRLQHGFSWNMPQWGTVAN